MPMFWQTNINTRHFSHIYCYTDVLTLTSITFLLFTAMPMFWQTNINIRHCSPIFCYADVLTLTPVTFLLFTAMFEFQHISK